MRNRLSGILAAALVVAQAAAVGAKAPFPSRPEAGMYPGPVPARHTTLLITPPLRTDSAGNFWEDSLWRRLPVAGILGDSGLESSKNAYTFYLGYAENQFHFCLLSPPDSLSASVPLPGLAFVLDEKETLAVLNPGPDTAIFRWGTLIQADFQSRLPPVSIRHLRFILNPEEGFPQAWQGRRLQVCLAGPGETWKPTLPGRGGILLFPPRNILFPLPDLYLYPWSPGPNCLALYSLPHFLRPKTREAILRWDSGQVKINLFPPTGQAAEKIYGAFSIAESQWPSLAAALNRELIVHFPGGDSAVIPLPEPELGPGSRSGTGDTLILSLRPNRDSVFTGDPCRGKVFLQSVSGPVPASSQVEVWLQDQNGNWLFPPQKFFPPKISSAGLTGSWEFPTAELQGRGNYYVGSRLLNHGREQQKALYPVQIFHRPPKPWTIHTVIVPRDWIVGPFGGNGTPVNDACSSWAMKLLPPEHLLAVSALSGFFPTDTSIPPWLFSSPRKSGPAPLQVRRIISHKWAGFLAFDSVGSPAPLAILPDGAGDSISFLTAMRFSGEILVRKPYAFKDFLTKQLWRAFTQENSAAGFLVITVRDSREYTEVKNLLPSFHLGNLIELPLSPMTKWPELLRPQPVPRGVPVLDWAAVSAPVPDTSLVPRRELWRLLQLGTAASSPLARPTNLFLVNRLGFRRPAFLTVAATPRKWLFTGDSAREGQLLPGANNNDSVLYYFPEREALSVTALAYKKSGPRVTNIMYPSLTHVFTPAKNLHRILLKQDTLAVFTLSGAWKPAFTGKLLSRVKDSAGTRMDLLHPLQGVQVVRENGQPASWSLEVHQIRTDTLVVDYGPETFFFHKISGAWILCSGFVLPGPPDSMLSLPAGAVITFVSPRGRLLTLVPETETNIISSPAGETHTLKIRMRETAGFHLHDNRRRDRMLLAIPPDRGWLLDSVSTPVNTSGAGPILGVTGPNPVFLRFLRPDSAGYRWIKMSGTFSAAGREYSLENPGDFTWVRLPTTGRIPAEK
jgi:hypothetical protein